MYLHLLVQIFKQNLNSIEAFTTAFDSSLDTCKEKIAKYYEDLIMADNSIHTLKLLKFFLMFDCTTFDHTFSGKLNPSLVNFKNSLIASGIAPYFTYPHENKLIPGRIDSVEKLNVCFLFNEPLCKRITESIFSKPEVKSKINIDDDAFWQSNFLALVPPKENEKN